MGRRRRNVLRASVGHERALAHKDRRHCLIRARARRRPHDPPDRCPAGAAARPPAALSSREGRNSQRGKNIAGDEESQYRPLEPACEAGCPTDDGGKERFHDPSQVGLSSDANNAKLSQIGRKDLRRALPQPWFFLGFLLFLVGSR